MDVFTLPFRLLLQRRKEPELYFQLLMETTYNSHFSMQIKCTLNGCMCFPLESRKKIVNYVTAITDEAEAVCFSVLYHCIIYYFSVAPGASNRG